MRVRAPGALGWEEASLLRLHGNWENDGAGPLEERKTEGLRKPTPPPRPAGDEVSAKDTASLRHPPGTVTGRGGGHSIKSAASPPDGLSLSENLGAVSEETGEGAPSSLIL